MPADGWRRLAALPDTDGAGQELEREANKTFTYSPTSLLRSPSGLTQRGPDSEVTVFAVRFSYIYFSEPNNMGLFRGDLNFEMSVLPSGT